jgi:hypothetical protein
MKSLLFILSILLVKICGAQDSTTAVYINDLVQKIEARISTDIMEKKDTSIFDEGDSLQRGAFLTVHTEFFTNPQTMMLDKIVEKSLYKKTSTELTIYFYGDQAIRFTNKQWEGSTVQFDFDIYYMSDNTVYVRKRSNFNGTPDGNIFLKWCYQLRSEYFAIVQQYNQTFARSKIKSR